jgi:putative membrane protein
LLFRIRISFDAFIKTLILFGYMMFLTWLIGTNAIQLYIHPRYLQLTQMTVMVLLVLVIVQALQIIYLKQDNHCRHSSRTLRSWLGYMPFLVSLLLAFCLPSSTLNAKLVGTKGFNTGVTAVSEETLAGFAVTMQQMAMIEVTDENYINIISELRLHPEKYAGKQITVTGFVYKDLSFPASNLALVRFVTFCCSADAIPAGILCQVADEQNYPIGTWLTVQGTLAVSEHQKKTIPLISAARVTPVEEPAQPYIYP